jgi:hypothetical protein
MQSFYWMLSFFVAFLIVNHTTLPGSTCSYCKQKTYILSHPWGFPYGKSSMVAIADCKEKHKVHIGCLIKGISDAHHKKDLCKTCTHKSSSKELTYPMLHATYSKGLAFFLFSICLYQAVQFCCSLFMNQPLLHLQNQFHIIIASALFVLSPKSLIYHPGPAFFNTPGLKEYLYSSLFVKYMHTASVFLTRFSFIYFSMQIGSIDQAWNIILFTFLVISLPYYYFTEFHLDHHYSSILLRSLFHLYFVLGIYSAMQESPKLVRSMFMLVPSFLLLTISFGILSFIDTHAIFFEALEKSTSKRAVE